MPPGYVVIAAQARGLITLEERPAATREAADTEFDALREKYPEDRVFLGDPQGNVLRQFPDPLD